VLDVLLILFAECSFSGLEWKAYYGYTYSDAIFFFEPLKWGSSTGAYQGYSSNLYSLDTATRGAFSNDDTTYDYSRYSGLAFFCIEWEGLFLPNSTGSWRFSFSASTAIVLWIGPNAVGGYYNTSNANLHVERASGSCLVTLTAGVYYDFRLQFGHNTGAYSMYSSFSSPTGEEYDTGDGFFFYNTPASAALLKTTVTCQSYSASNTDFALQNYVECSFYANLSDSLMAGVSKYQEIVTTVIIALH